MVGGQRRDQPRQQGIGEGAHLIGDFEDARVAPFGAAGQPQRQHRSHQSDDDEQRAGDVDRAIVAEDHGGGGAGDPRDRAGDQADRLAVERCDQLAAHPLVAIAAREVPFEDVA